MRLPVEIEAGKSLAACRGVDPALFYPDRYDDGNRDVAAACRICASCPVKRDCLIEALHLSPYYDDGIWAGTTPRQRRKLRRLRLSA